MASPVPLEGTRRAGALAVAACATLSLVATVSFLFYVAFLLVVARSRHPRREWANRRAAVLGTPFGLMFINLVVADLVQALGFFLNYMWIAQGSWTSPSAACSAQAFLIQVGDVASALSNLLISVHTFFVLSPKWKPPNWPFPLVLTGLWLVAVGLGIAGPTAHGGWGIEQTYWAWTGEWCWVSADYQIERLYLHYVWIFAAASGSAVLYLILFLRLHSYEKSTNSEQEQAATGVSGVSHARTTAQQRAKALNRASRYMLLYPICFVIVVLPLAMFRLAGMTGHNWSHDAASAAGSIFTLSGIVDVIIYGLTRRIIAAPHIMTFRRHRITVAQDGSRLEIGEGGQVLPKAVPGFSLRVDVQQSTIIEEEEADIVAEKGGYFEPRSPSPLIAPQPRSPRFSQFSPPYSPRFSRPPGSPRFWDRPASDSLQNLHNPDSVEHISSLAPESPDRRSSGSEGDRRVGHDRVVIPVDLPTTPAPAPVRFGSGLHSGRTY